MHSMLSLYYPKWGSCETTYLRMQYTTTPMIRSTGTPTAGAMTAMLGPDDFSSTTSSSFSSSSLFWVTLTDPPE